MNLEFYLIRMDRLFEDYAADAQELERNRKPNELFGLKFGPTDDPRHDRFADELAALLSDFVAEDPESGAVRASGTPVQRGRFSVRGDTSSDIRLA